MTARRRAVRGGIRYSKFSAVGAVNTAVDVGVLNLLIWLFPAEENLRLVVYNLVALVAANLNSYLLNSRWTFRERARGDLRQKVLFAAQAVVNVGVATALFWLMVRVLFGATALPPVLEANIAKAVSMVGASTLSFFIMRYVVFRGRKPGRWL
ncbi:GtrA family protein [Rubrobacter taiwanensis]|uniref:GtrA family protein n=1 Tax=Rubrobacter taiwanensis TaxID=185139 RepID=UPI001404ABF2|nr:GtrA family protein [Rubrobacter taiwanensis]